MTDEIELRNTGNQPVIGKIPSWVARWGNVIVLAICLLLLYISFRLTFPVIVQGQVQVLDDSVYVIIPQTKQDLITEGQSISLRMDDYPYMDYGILQGKALLPNNAIRRENAVYIRVQLSDGSNTVKQKDLLPGMRGTGDIIIDQVPLIYRIFITK